MTANIKPQLEALITILDVELEDVLIDICEKNHMPIALFTYGQGSVKSKFFEMLGYGGPRKIVSISINTNMMCRFVMNRLNSEIDLQRPGTGIVFTINISSISRILSKVCMDGDEKLGIGSENVIVTSKEPYHLIIAIVNSGHFDQVMDAAKAAGANGGTLIHARSIGSKEAIKYLGITVQPEKDLVLILTRQENKLAIMESVVAKAGLSTSAAGYCFSLPVNDVMGVEAVIDNFDELID